MDIHFKYSNRNTYNIRYASTHTNKPHIISKQRVCALKWSCCLFCWRYFRVLTLFPPKWLFVNVESQRYNYAISDTCMSYTNYSIWYNILSVYYCCILILPRDIKKQVVSICIKQSIDFLSTFYFMETRWKNWTKTKIVTRD